MFNFIQIHSFKGVLQQLYGGITFFTVFQKISFLLCSLLALASAFRVMNIPKKPQALMASSFKMEVKQISPFCLSRLGRSLLKI